MHTLFISDLHLQPHNAQQFLWLLQNDPWKIESLYILGDFFEFWVGDDLASSFQISILQALHNFSRMGKTIYVMVGNRDFLLSSKLLKKYGCNPLPDPTIIELYGHKIYLTHGDALCTEDISHQYFRKFSRASFIKKLFLCLPGSWRQRIGQGIRGFSRDNNKQRQFKDIPQPELMRIFQQYGVKEMIHGHTHVPSIDFFYHEEGLRQRYVLSDWDEHGQGLLCSSSGSKQFVTF